MAFDPPSTPGPPEPPVSRGGGRGGILLVDDFVAETPAVSGPPGTVCATFAACRDLLHRGQEIDYEGVSGPVDLDDRGDPGSAVLQIYAYGPDGRAVVDRVTRGED